MAGRVARPIGINHVALEVGDLDAALAFYGALFELRLRGRVPGMAFVDLGDQFLALSEGREQPPDDERHVGLVVDDQSLVRARLRELGVAEAGGRGLAFRDPWGNHVEIVQYDAIQFTKTRDVLEALGAGDLRKSEAALAELRERGLVRE
jgi:catechol 2,3-dioxygenase-like lactoylglutathione lyase family enzyme